jgi:nitrogen-specific signal transduction histidine kinase
LFTIEDVTERRHLEAQLRQSQKMEAIGQLTGGVAHDFNNLLAIILGNVELLNERIQGAPDQRMMFQEVIAAAMRGAKLTQHLLAYSRQQPLEPRSVDVRQLVIDLVGLLRRTIGERITIHLSLPDELGHARIDPSQLENALLNLALNARDAMPDTGQLAIEAENIIIEPVAADKLAEIVPGAYVQLAVTDNGVGMSNDIRDRVLEPFFTTKPAGAGSGLGLSMVYGFVKQSGGHLKIYSELGHGTSVRLYLPRQYLPADAQETQAFALPQGGGELILVVEDDAAVRRLAVRMLTGFGYRTCEAADAGAALTLLEASPPIQLLLTDVMLPHGVTGAKLAAEVKQQRPGTKVMFMSGYTKNVILHRGSIDSGLHFIAKPFPKAELARKVRAALDEG